MMAWRLAHNQKTRGVALISAIAVLGVLTILLTALAFSQQTSLGQRAQSQSRDETEGMVRFALQASQGLLLRAPGRIIDNESRFEFDAGLCVCTGRLARDGDSWYQSPWLARRQGDVHLTVRVEPSGNLPAMTRRFLVNASPENRRIIPLSRQVTPKR